MVKNKSKNKEKAIKKASVRLSDNNIDLAKTEVIESETTEMIIKDLTKDSIIGQIKSILDKTEFNDLKSREKTKQEISTLLQIYNEKLALKTDIDKYLKNKKKQDFRDINKALDKSENYLAIVFFFWSIDTMNFRIIGLTEIIPLLEIIDTRELYYLDVPTLSAYGIPVYIVIKGITCSVNMDFKYNLENSVAEFKAKGISPDVMRAMTDSVQFLKIYGKQRITTQFIVIVVLLMIIEFFIVFTTMWWIK